jgi:hypothetical protein
MMGIGPTEAAGLDFWTYEGLLYNWNEAQRSDDDVPPPDPVATMALLERLAADPRLTH